MLKRYPGFGSPLFGLLLAGWLLVACAGPAAPPTIAPPSPPPATTPTAPPSPPPASTPAPPPTNVDPATAPAVQAAIADLARRRSVDVSRIAVGSSNPVDWPDAGLGCPEPGRAYAQVITPGWRIQLTVDGQTVIYHTDRAGRQVTPCPRQP